MKKEELQIKIGKLEEKNKNLLERDEFMRKEISEALDSFELYQEIGYSRKDKAVKTLSWFQIMKEIGKLKAALTFYDLDGNISELEYRLDKLESGIRGETHFKTNEEQGKDK